MKTALFVMALLFAAFADVGAVPDFNYNATSTTTTTITTTPSTTTTTTTPTTTEKSTHSGKKGADKYVYVRIQQKVGNAGNLEDNAASSEGAQGGLVPA